MHVTVNGVRLFFDVEGTELVPDGPVMREKPTLLMLHGGPGADHSIYKPAYSALADVAQIIYLDHRGNGRSEDGPREGWNLAQWGDDVRAFCDALGIADPIVLGASFGGMVALAYATRHPAHPSKLILISTAASGAEHLDRRIELFERFGGPEAGALARRRFLEVRGHRTRPRSTPGDGWRCRITSASRAIPIWRAAPSAGRRCCSGSRRPGGESHSFNLFPRSASHPVPDAGARRRGRSDSPDREPGRYRGRAAAASGAIRAVCRLRACRDARCAGARHRRDPGFYHGRTIQLAAQNKTGARRRRL